MMNMMRYFMLKNVKNSAFNTDKFLYEKFIVNISPVLITGFLIISTSILNVSCKTCKCPAYSMHEINKANTTGASKEGNFLFDKKLANAKNGINQSI